MSRPEAALATMAKAATAVSRPSLVRRLVLAQLVTLAGLWIAVVVFFAFDAARNDDSYDPKLMAARADMVLGVVTALADRPAELQQALQRIDVFQRSEGGDPDHPASRITMNVWLGEVPIFVSPGLPGMVQPQRRDELERLVAGGAEWRSFTRVAPDTSSRANARVTLLRAGDAPLVLMSLASRGLLVLPLVVSLPLLLLPAWLSVHLALRPWRQLAREMETRTPDDLSPLRFRARHAELQPLTRALDRLLSRVRDGVQRERSFIADAAHELRTPLAAMRVHVDALQQRPLAAGDRHLLEGLGRSGERASRLVGQLLALMRSDAHRSSPGVSRLSLVELAQDRLAALAPLAEAREVELEFSGAREALIEGEREGLTSLLDNLIENAIKYSPTGGTVRVSVQASAQDGLHRAELRVEDEGPGIAPEHRARVFDRFYRVPDQSLPGSGLGLAIVRSVADRHGASLRLDDREHGPGLRVTVGFVAVP